jgi:phosphoribosylformimino-5-aminoimidazole carboxamide ribotide isomerase
MLIIPAIDLKDGQCVRLKQGRMADSTVFSDDPLAMAGHWLEQGARRLHLVDLNGAFAGEPVNGEIVKSIAMKYPQLPIQIGGGIRTRDTVKTYLDAGVDHVIIGTKALQDPEFVTDMCREFPDHIMVGIDAKEGRVATHGWAELSSLMAVDLVQRFANDGVSAVVYTDIERDGMMQGVNLEATVAMAKIATIPIIASGGVTNLEDIRHLLDSSEVELFGAITGRAIYEGTLDVLEAQELCDRTGAR